MNNKESENEIKNRNDEQRRKFCPLIKDMCNLRCVCYYKPIFVRLGDDDGHVTGGHCQAHVLMGGGY